MSKSDPVDDVFDQGYRAALEEIYADLEAMTDEDGSLNGGDTVEYIYSLFAAHDILKDDDHLCDFSVPISNWIAVTVDADENGRQLTGTRDELLLLARNIHDTLEGADQ